MMLSNGVYDVVYMILWMGFVILVIKSCRWYDYVYAIHRPIHSKITS